ncbi:MAG: SDR family NAD(P)-dependent oxidoreductase [Myxococcota bacterium]|nr:SDR family NAD(P)-dependent oxidoreductase [Myxococcota bacterium]
MSLYSTFTGKGPSGFGYGSTAEEVTAEIDLTGKRILVTGCNSGLGLETMRVLSMRGATVIGAARSLEKAAAATKDLAGETEAVACELGDPGSVRACIQTLKAHAPLDIVIANAGIMALPKRELVCGYEKQFFINHVGHFILVSGLLDHLTDDARVVMLSSAAHAWTWKEGIRFDDLSAEREYNDIKNYGQSKLCNLLMARELGRRFEGTERRAYGVHPGVINTNLGRHMTNPLMALFSRLGPLLVLKSIAQGAATQSWAAASPGALDHSGAYLANANVKKSSSHGQNLELARRLWTHSEQIVAGLD